MTYLIPPFAERSNKQGDNMNTNALIASIATIVYVFAGAYIWVCPVKGNCAGDEAAVAEAGMSSEDEAGTSDEGTTADYTDATADAAESAEGTEAADMAEDMDSASADGGQMAAEGEEAEMTEGESEGEEALAMADDAATEEAAEAAAEPEMSAEEIAAKKAEEERLIAEREAAIARDKAKIKSEAEAMRFQKELEASRDITKENIGPQTPRAERIFESFAYHTIYFHLNNEEVTTVQRDYKFFDKLKIYLDKAPESNVLITGHTDSSGIEMFNEDLALNRAINLKNLLTQSGISEERMRIESLGEFHPKASNSTEEGRAKNRRAEIIIE